MAYHASSYPYKVVAVLQLKDSKTWTLKAEAAKGYKGSDQIENKVITERSCPTLDIKDFTLAKIDSNVLEIVETEKEVWHS